MNNEVSKFLSTHIEVRVNPDYVLFIVTTYAVEYSLYWTSAKP